ncbi:hypothetical protein RvY_16054-1 [Ramazzottius varieornatus]|uniref:ABC-type glutathione-S-conjugate transporter n=1 Tax=Ramazzottius varieornatus TaxID=947166 RepID=A0A1D1VY51_RAMVA|nr:hypothetical protein RvY_16054-1 [Ramazzottius varieornatus]
MNSSRRTSDPFPPGFCADPFWDSEVSWNTDDFDLTQCFQWTILVWIPCAFLWAALPLKYLLASKSPYQIHRWTWLSSLKITVSFVLVIHAFIQLSFYAHIWRTEGLERIADAEIVTCFVRIATFLLAAFVIFMEKRRAKPTSAVMFLFWLLVFIAACLTFASALRRRVLEDQLDKFRFHMELTYFPIVLLQFILSCWADNFPELTAGVPNPCPEEHASYPSKMTFWWITGLIYTGWRRTLVRADLWDLEEKDKTEVHASRLEKYWGVELKLNQQSKGRPARKQYLPSLTKALCKTFWLALSIGAGLRFLNDLLTFLAPFQLKLLIQFINNKNVQSWKGYVYATGLLLGSCAQVLVLAHYFVTNQRTGMHIRSAVVTAVYRKALRMSSAAKRSSTIGEVVNLMAVDSQRFMDLMTHIQLLWSAPLQISIALYFLWQEMGLATLAGLVAMVLLIPFNAWVAGRTKTLQIAQMKIKDGRIKLMNEILNGMKILKLYAWESSFERQVLEIRENELNTLRRAAYLNSLSSFIMQISPFMVALVTFTTFVMISEDNILDAEKAFVSLTLFNILRRPLALLPDVIQSLVQAKVSVNRVTKFLLNEELDPDSVRRLPSSDIYAVRISGGNFSWDGGPDAQPMLRDINLSVADGTLVAIVGQVGTGKSSLVAAMLGLMEKLSGDVAVKENIAYVTQQAWIQNLTLKDNILFGKPFDEKKYERVLEACALKEDLAMLPAGDQTEIGEKGINMSGGQKQRISLARAVYGGADIFFLDDPLSAVDAHVGKHIFENVTGPNGMLHNRTRILVTHGVGFLPQTDSIVVLNAGQITEVGCYQTLLRNNGAFADFLRTYLADPNLDDDDPESANIKEGILEELNSLTDIKVPSERASMAGSVSRVTLERVKSVMRQTSRLSIVGNGAVGNGLTSGLTNGVAGKGSKMAPAVEEPKKGQLVGVEKSETGSVHTGIYVMFLRNMTWTVVAGIFVSYILSNSANLATNIWLGQWADDSRHPERSTDTSWTNYRLGVYGALGSLQGIFILMSALCLAVGQIYASRKQHEGMLRRIMRAPMVFFDTTPLGRIVNRFSKDVDYVDTVIPTNFRTWLNCLFQVIATVVIVCMTTPIFASVVVPLGLLYYFIQRFYIPTSRQLKRLESVSCSPIYSHFQESITGSSVIVAQRQMERFILENERLLDYSNRSYFPSLYAQRWLAILVEFIGICAVFFAGLFAVVGRDKDWGINAKDIGLSISYALNVTQILNMMVRSATELEANIVSVERIQEYTEIQQEAPWIIASNRAKDNWPAEGRVTFKNYQTRYRPGLQLVLRGVDADMQPGEKVGIVGRTGAGKSSLTLALFRLIEAADGSLSIDGVDVSTLGLHDLRSRLTIIPQEPVLFSGSLRMNLDPFDTYTDDEIWNALVNAHLRTFVTSLPDGLQHLIAEGGENLSVGQRQLICLARALLRKSKILVLDEATAAIDLETDALIQTTIRQKFADCTVLTIAHRLNTIMDSTRIMVLDHGIVREFAPPSDLLNDKSSVFYALAKSANLVH